MALKGVYKLACGDFLLGFDHIPEKKSEVEEQKKKRPRVVAIVDESGMRV